MIVTFLAQKSVTHPSLRKFLPALGIPPPRAEDFWVLTLKMCEFRMWLNHPLKILPLLV